MAEYTITQIVSYERDFHQMFANQKYHNWSQDGKISNHRLISDLTIGILGTGTIGMKSNVNVIYILQILFLYTGLLK